MTTSREYPARPIPGVGVVVCKDDHVLLIRRGHPPSQGDWGLPGGALELGETWREAAVREVREECGIEITLGDVADVVDIVVRDESDRVQYHFAIVDFAADYVSGEVCAQGDAMDARWVAIAELPKVALSQRTRKVIAQVIDRR